MTDVNKLITDNIDVWTSAIKKRNSQGRGSSSKVELIGVKKLRELILELAVRGKLVPQDDNDEPANVLLEEIAEQKAQLIINKKIKNKKNIPEITDEEKPFELPKSWEWSQLGAICEIGPRNQLEDDLDVGFVPMPLISTSYKGAHGLETRKWSEIKKGYTHFADGDIGLAKITPCFENSKAAVFSNLTNGYGAGTTELHIARPIKNTIDPLFILLFLKAPIFLEVGKSKMTGSAGQKRVPNDYFSGRAFPFAPLAEQHRIVAKVDELMALCDQLEQQTEQSLLAHQTLVEALLNTLTQSINADDFQENWQRIADHFDVLFTTESSIDQLKQTILQLAVMGKLVPQASREARKSPNYEPASKLLEKIAEEKAQLIKDKKIKKQKPLPTITDEEKPFELPNGWEWCKFGEISHLITDGAHHTPKYIESGVPFLSVKDMSSGILSFNDTRFISQEQHEDLSKRCSPKKGDLLLTKIGTTGVPVIIDTDIEFSIFVSVALIKFPIDKINGQYLTLLIKSPVVKKQSSEGTEGVGNKNLVLRKIAVFNLAIPPLAEQHRIVAKVDKLMVVCDQLKARLADAQITQLHLADVLVSNSLVNK